MSEESILTSIKKLLGMDEDYEHFDVDVIIHINSALSTLTQLGVGPSTGFIIRDEGAAWREFTGNDPKFESAKDYIYLRCKLIFDPPASAAAIDSLKEQVKELEWRLEVAASSKV